MEIIQENTHTYFNRYQRIFKRARLVKPECKKILSFGCSGGEECVTALAYFPEAMITGVDANEIMLNIARIRFKHEQIIFSDTPIGKYDLILCNSVLCVNPPPDKLDDAFTFPEFEKIVKRFDSMLPVWGMIMMVNSAFKLSDALSNYEPVGEPMPFEVDVFTKEGVKTESIGFPLWKKVK